MTSRPASSSRPDIFCLMNSPWWQTNLRSRSCIRLQASHRQEVAWLMLRRRFRKAKYAASTASCSTEPSALVGDRVEEGRVALELGEPERRPQPPHHGVHHVGDDVLRMLELDPGEKAGVAGDVRDHETSGFGFRKHRAVPSS